MDTGLAELCLGDGKPVATQIVCVDPIAIFGEVTGKAIVPPTMFGNAVSKLNDCLDVDFRRRKPLANGQRRTIDNRGNMIVHRLHTMVRCRFCHKITIDLVGRSKKS